MDRFAALTGRAHSLFEYRGSPDAESVMVIMGSGAETVAATVDALGSTAKVGVLTVKLYRPFRVDHFLAALPSTVCSVAVLDRTKEPGAIGEPLYQAVVTATHEGPADRHIQVIGGRYGLGSKDFTPAMVKAVFAELVKDAPKRHFTVGIVSLDQMRGSMSLSRCPDAASFERGNYLRVLQSWHRTPTAPGLFPRETRHDSAQTDPRPH